MRRFDKSSLPQEQIFDFARVTVVLYSASLKNIRDIQRQSRLPDLATLDHAHALLTKYILDHGLMLDVSLLWKSVIIVS